MKYLVGILIIGLSYTIYLLIAQHNELYSYKNGTGIDNCLLNEKKAKEYIQNYQAHFCIDSNKTKGIWFSEDLVRCLYINLIRQDKKDTVDGFRVYLATYTGDVACNTIKSNHKIANTVIFVPTTSFNNGHKDLWTLIKKDKEKMRLGLQLLDVPNHGELCPQQCSFETQ